MTEAPNNQLAKVPEEAAKPTPEASHWDQMEKREGLLWRYILGILIVMALGLAVTSWETFRVLPMRLEALPIGLAHNVKLLRDIPAGRIITWPDVAMADTDAVRARREMQRRFSPLSVATTTLAAK